MKTNRVLPILLVCLFTHLLISSLHAQSISGVINRYEHVVNIDPCLNTATVGSTDGFSIGGTVLIMQMKALKIDESNSPSFGTILDPMNVGKLELATIKEIPDRNSLRFANTLLNTYQVIEGEVQIISVPYYDDVVVADKLTAQPWDPISGTGGVLIFKSRGTVTLKAPIDVSGLGFKGGEVTSNGAAANVTSYFSHSWDGVGGLKGEGAVQTPAGMDAGRGSLGNAGGGGNSHNSGGGGGALFGDGGVGGHQSNRPGYGDFPNGGMGGHGFHTGVITLGGGGGAGHQNDGGGTAGGTGGGIAIIFAQALDMGSNPIAANGLDALTSYYDGAGGGGSGGVIVLQVSNIRGDGTIEAHGGEGGDADSRVSNSSPNLGFAYGPGGGGAGGIISFPGSPSSMAYDVRGAAPGLVINCSDNKRNNSYYGANSGADGSVLPLSVPSSSTPYNYPAIDKHQLTICAGEAAFFTASGATSYDWSPSAGLSDLTAASQAVYPTGSTTYNVTMSRNGCTFIDSVHVTVMAKPIASFKGATSICKGDAASYTVSPVAGASYTWQAIGGTVSSTSGNTVTVTWTTPGTDTIKLTSMSGSCSAEASLAVSVMDVSAPEIQGKSSLCTGTPITLRTKQTYSSYHWSTGETTDSIVVATPGTFTVTVTNAGGCSSKSSDFVVTQNSEPKATIVSSSTTLPRTGAGIQLTVKEIFDAYQWSTGETTNSILVMNPGTYTVTVTDANGCSGIATISILKPEAVPTTVLSLPTIEASPGDHVILPVMLSESHNLDRAGATALTYRISFDRSLLVPVDRSLTSVISDGRRSLTKTELLPASGSQHILSSSSVGNTTLSQIEFIATLGDSTETVISFDTAYWTSTTAIQTTFTGSKFLLKGTCPQGGTRLFKSIGALHLSTVTPNPAHSLTSIDYELLESGPMQLSLMDMLGRSVAVIRDQSEDPGKYHTLFDVSSIPNGPYYLQLRTPSDVLRTKVQIYH